MSRDHEVITLEHEVFHSKPMFFEYTKLVDFYSKAKDLLKQGYYLDSLHCVHQSLQHMARLAVLEAGESPEMLLWKQVKRIDSSVYKLYEELSTSQEPLDKRIELFLLALDFFVLSKLANGVRFLLDLLKSRTEPWTVDDILLHSAIDDQDFALTSVLEKMEKKSLIRAQLIERNGSKQKGYRYF